MDRAYTHAFCRVHSSFNADIFTLFSSPIMAEGAEHNQPMDDTVGVQVHDMDHIVPADFLQQINQEIRTQIAAQFAAAVIIQPGPGAPGAPLVVPVAAPLRAPNFNWGNIATDDQPPAVSTKKLYCNTLLHKRVDSCKKVDFSKGLSINPISMHDSVTDGNKHTMGKKQINLTPFINNTNVNRQVGAQPSRRRNPLLNVSVNTTPTNGNNLSHSTNRLKNEVQLGTNGKRHRDESPTKSPSKVGTCSSIGSDIQRLETPARKKRKMIQKKIVNQNPTLKQCTLDAFLSKPRVPYTLNSSGVLDNSLDEVNIANLEALASDNLSVIEEDGATLPHTQLPDSSTGSSPTPGIGITSGVGSRGDHIDREPLLFNNANKLKIVWVLDEDKHLNQDNLKTLISEIRTHDQRILESSIIRVKSQMRDKNFVKQRGKKSKNRVKINNDSNLLPSQGETPMMPNRSKTTWNQARNAAVEAAKSTNRAAFYNEAPMQGLLEYWCYGLERTPGYLMKLPDFRADLHAMRVKHAKEQMKLAATHMEREIKIHMDHAADLRATSVASIQKSDPENAERIIQEASVAYDITVANMAGNEFRDLDKRRQTLETSPRL